MDGGGEICLEEKVERLRRSGMTPEEISAQMGLDPEWVADLVDSLPDEDEPEDRS
ncbi:MAG: hypothetical protein WA982_03105 [Rubrobacteraceae bacterium]